MTGSDMELSGIWLASRYAARDVKLSNCVHMHLTQLSLEQQIASARRVMCCFSHNRCSWCSIHSLLSLQAQMERQKQQQRQQHLQAAGQHSNRIASFLHRLWLQGGSAIADNLSRVLILSVFGFKVGGTLHSWAVA